MNVSYVFLHSFHRDPDVQREREEKLTKLSQDPDIVNKLVKALG